MAGFIIPQISHASGQALGHIQQAASANTNTNNGNQSTNSAQLAQTSQAAAEKREVNRPGDDKKMGVQVPKKTEANFSGTETEDENQEGKSDKISEKTPRKRNRSHLDLVV